MKPLLALALAIAAMVAVRELGGERTSVAAATPLALGFALMGALITGEALRRFQLPRLTGYLLFGVIVGPYVSNLITAPMAAQLQVFTGIATTLIALIAGLTLSVERLGSRIGAIVRMTLTTLAVAMAGLAVVGWLVWRWLPVAPYASGVELLAMLALMTVIVVSFSPTMTAAVVADSGARGRLSDTVLAMVVLADLVLLVVFAVSMQVARVVFDGGGWQGAEMLARLAWEIGGAVAFGVLVGVMFALYLRYIGREITLVLLAVCALLSQVGTTQQLQPLLAAVAAGIVIENLAVAQGDTLRAAVRRGAPPVLVVFFVAVGASLRLDALSAIGLAAVALSVVRIGFIRIGANVGAKVSGLPDPIRKYAWTGLVSQAGITLGFAAVIAAEFPGWGHQLQLLLVGSIAIHELIGPLLFRRGLTKAGELDAHSPRPLVVVSNREPYIHNQAADGSVTVSAATGGVAVALDALMRERGGVWIAHGGGSADRQVVDASDKVAVPPENPSYTLRRLWLEEPTFSQYYGGFANEGLWPLCHVVDVRPKFRSEDWEAYQDINTRFAKAIDSELGATESPVFIQDYHLALVAPALRQLRPETRTALFWHIPWPYPDRLRICPWRRELVAGLLANDLLAFQVERDRRNFLLAAEEELDAEVELESSRVRLNGRTTTVVSVPIGVDYDRIQGFAADAALAKEQERLIELLGLRAEIIGLGVDRLDYTKGIPERLSAIDALMAQRPDLRGRVTFVQIGVPSRSDLDSYAAIETEIGERIAELNARYAMPGRPPVVTYYTTPLGAFSLVALYRLAHFCIVSSLHDGMNLVAKEFVAARDDEQGVLVLSALAGAAQELEDAVIINPYDVTAFAAALQQAIEMAPDEQARRMHTMRKIVAGRNVFNWASDILEGLESIWTKPLLYSVRGWEDTSV
ncbi:MAG: trehalose-6-phosphate synthase [Acidobacteriota bacterium]|nr:trehalose-6-phosphate synthase [Acidobacteriota bacterium]